MQPNKRPKPAEILPQTAPDPTRPVHVTLADHFANPRASRSVVRIVLVSGEEVDGYAPSFDPDELVLVVTTTTGVRTIRPAEIRALFERRPSWPFYAAATGAIVLLAGGLSAFLVPLLSPLSGLQGAVIGAIAGAGAAYAVSSSVASLAPVEYARGWQRIAPLTRWRTIIPASRRLPDAI